jgi:hypothetical protein
MIQVIALNTLLLFHPVERRMGEYGPESRALNCWAYERVVVSEGKDKQSYLVGICTDKVVRWEDEKKMADRDAAEKAAREGGR